MVTKLFKLGFVEAEQMRNVLAQFTSRDSDLQIVPPNTLILSDLGLNMRRLEKLIEQLDQPGGSQEIHIVAVQHAGAQDLAQKLSEILQAQAGSKLGSPAAAAAVGGRGAKLIADERTNKLVVIAGDNSFQSVLDLVRQLDIPTGDGGVHVYYLENAKAEDVASTLQSFAQGLSGKRRAAGPPSAPTPFGTAPTPFGTAPTPFGTQSAD